MDERKNTTSRLKFGLRRAGLILEGEIHGAWVPVIFICVAIGSAAYLAT
jgi:hypothetical protein